MTGLLPRAGGALVAVATLLAVAAPPSAEAAFTFVVRQVGPDVVVEGSGTIRLAGLSPALTSVDGSLIEGGVQLFTVGSFSATQVYSGVTGPASFLASVVRFASAESGDLVGLDANGDPPNFSGAALYLPRDYVSGDPLSSAATFSGTTLAELGLAVGTTLVWTWGDGQTSDTLSIVVPPGAVPAPPAAALLGVGLLGLALRRAGRA